jgi:hypothetical protein
MFGLPWPAEPNRHEPDRHEPNRHEPDRHEPDRHEPDRYEPNRDEPDRYEPDRYEPDRYEPNRYEPNRDEPNRDEPNRPEALQGDEQFDLTGQPRHYVHLVCGEPTQMPEEQLRNYLTNPYYYPIDRTYCPGCGVPVPLRHCYWIETRENLQVFLDRLRAEHADLEPPVFFRCITRFLKLWA